MTLSSGSAVSLDYTFVGTRETPPSERPLWADAALLSEDKQKEIPKKFMEEDGGREGGRGRKHPALQAPALAE